MKKSILIIAVALLATGTSMMAQGPQRRTVEERVSAVHQKIDSAFKPDAATLAKVDSAFAAYYRGTDKVREELRSGGERPDPQVMREKMQPLGEARDKELQAVLGDDKFKIWKSDIEPSMRPQRGPGGNRPNQ
jgi:hypothetical protein